MAKLIEQVVRFPVTAAELFETYIDSEKHAAAIQSEATLSREVGGSFAIFGGKLTGRNLAVVDGRMIVQAWRGSDFREDDLDSVLILTFRDVEGGAELHMTHANLPEHMYESVKNGWNRFYWSRWQEYFRNRQGSQSHG